MFYIWHLLIIPAPLNISEDYVMLYLWTLLMITVPLNVSEDYIMLYIYIVYFDDRRSSETFSVAVFGFFITLHFKLS